MLAALAVIQGRGEEAARQNDTNPVLSFLPMNRDDDERTLIKVDPSNESNYHRWSENTQESLKKYYVHEPEKKGKFKICTFKNGPKGNEVCDVDVKDFQGCRRENFFNYHRGSPCIFLKLNQIEGWVPEVYSDPDELPTEMPDSLKAHIRNIKEAEKRNTIWVSCEGENPADIENMGPVAYYPEIQGFPSYYFPYRNSASDYLRPLVAVHFRRPTYGVVINIECRAWAKNIKYSREDGLGSARLELWLQ